MIVRSAVLPALALLLALGPLAAGCRSPLEDLQGGRLVFSDDFSAANLAPHWSVGRVDGPASKGGGPRNEADRLGHWRVHDGALHTSGERNQGLWLKVPLPDSVRIEFSAAAETDGGDIKFESFGDGTLHESGYIFVMGGWNNALSVLARRDEHETGRQRRDETVEKGRVYRMAVTRSQSVVRWFVDGRLYLQYRDSEPLRGDAHRFFSFNSWRTPLRFDDLAVYDLGAR